MQKQNRVRRLALWLLIAFVAVFMLRWAYEAFFTSHDITISYNTTYENAGGSSYNIASERVKQKDGAGQEVLIDQKYDKTANMKLQSDRFDEVNRSIRTLVTEYGAVIQSENLSGLSGAQSLVMTVGVLPDSFDAFVDAAKALARLTSFTVNKVDKTDEYRTLMAEINTLEGTKAAYLALQDQGGDLQDLLVLQEKLLEVERSLQSLGVDAGLFTSENSFCTVNISLTETASQTLSVGRMLRYAASSFTWTLCAFVALFLLVLGLYAFAALLLWMNAKLRQLSRPEAQTRPEADRTPAEDKTDAPDTPDETKNEQQSPDDA